MVDRLTRNGNRLAACLLSLIYAFSVLAPTMANAFGLPPAAHHEGTRTAGKHEHVALHSHVHADADAHEDHGLAHEDQQSPSDALSGLQCCGLACLSALPAAMFDSLAPPDLKWERLALLRADPHSCPQSQRYRPPIS